MAGWCPAAGAVPQSDQIRLVEIIHWLEYCESSTGQELSTSTRCDEGTWSELRQSSRVDRRVELVLFVVS